MPFFIRKWRVLLKNGPCECVCCRCHDWAWFSGSLSLQFKMLRNGSRHQLPRRSAFHIWPWWKHYFLSATVMSSFRFQALNGLLKRHIFPSRQWEAHRKKPFSSHSVLSSLLGYLHIDDMFGGSSPMDMSLFLLLFTKENIPHCSC